MVRFSTVFPYRNVAKGDYEVVAQLPVRDGEFQYRIKSNSESHQRVVKEDELEGRPQQGGQSNNPGRGSYFTPL